MTGSGAARSGRDLRTPKAEIFGHVSKGTVCRVCGRDVDDGRRAYCGDRCREIADAVAKMLNWNPVREAVKERDDHTCQACGWDREMYQRAHWQIQERLDELNPHDPNDDREAWLATRERLRERYEPPEIGGGLLHVDHIVPIDDGGQPFDESNLQTLCRLCHEAKTARENSKPRDEPDAPQRLTLEDYMDEPRPAADGGEED